MYLEIVERYAIENTEPPAVAGGALTNAPAATSTPAASKPAAAGDPAAAGSAKFGDFVLYQFGRTWSHGAIVLDWPLVIHAVVQHGVIFSDGEREGFLVGRAKRFFSLWK